MHRVKQHGFTLLELLITITLVSVILVIILGGLRLSINAWKVGEERIEVYQRMRSVLRQLSHDIESGFLFYYTQDGFIKERYLAFEGRSDSFSITSSTDGLDRDEKTGAGIREISYFLERETNGQQVLKRRERFVHPSSLFEKNDSLEMIIVKDIVSFKVRYYLVAISSFDGKELPIGWQGSVTHLRETEKKQGNTGIRKIIPRAIEIRLSLAEKKGSEVKENILPPLVIPIHAGKKITAEIKTITPF